MIKQLIEEYAPLLKTPRDIDSNAVLWAVYRSEKYNKHNLAPRMEPAYAEGGRYYERSERVRELHTLWGNWAACSFSNFQILFIVADELGYTGPPLALDKDSVAIPYVVRYLNRRVFQRKAKTIEQIADAYNSGTHLDDNVPQRYINKFKRYYFEALKTCTAIMIKKTD